MKNRFFLAISAIMVTGALLLSATAQNNTILGGAQYRVGTTVYLKCDYHVGIDMFSLSAINNTNQTIPAGTKIYWQVNSTTKGSMALSAPLPAGKSVQVAQGDAPTTTASPKAWYLK
jgi:hypothetical protein